MDADIYVLANQRKAESIIKILDRYLPNRVYQLGDKNVEFEFWDDAIDAGNQPSLFFKSELELFTFLENQTKIIFRPSFRSTNNSLIRMVNFYYFQDDSLIVGLNIYQDSEREELLLDELKSLLNSDYGYISYHIPPESEREAFIRVSKDH